MPVQITMPALSPTMEEGTLTKWMVKEGDSISSGDIIAEIETDKATMELETVEDGTVGKLFVAEGTEGVLVNQVIAVILGEGESAADIAEPAAPVAVEVPVAPPPAEAPAPVAAPKAAPVPAAAAPAPAAPVAAAPKPAAPRQTGARVLASPVARRIAEQQGIDLSGVTGSGPHGRIVKADLEGVSSGAPARALVTTTGAAPEEQTLPPPVGEYEEIRLSGMRKTIAKRMAEAKSTIPHFYLTIDVRVDKLLAARADLNERSDDYKLSVNDFIIRAAALALIKYPGANAQFAGDRIYRFKQADVAVAVALDDGLITPIVRAADTKGLVEISNEVKDLAVRAREGKLTPEEYQGGTISISNLGMFDVREFSAVINPPQASILAVGVAEKRPVVEDDALAIATVMSVTMACDHRVIDGAMGAQFLQIFKGFLEDPLVMLL